MNLTRRNALRNAALAGGILTAGAAGLAPWRPALAAKPKLDIGILGFSLAIHVPAITALHQGFPAEGYPEPSLTRITSMRVVTQTIAAGASNLGESDAISALRAAESGADIKLVGLPYANTSQVYVANAAKIKSLEDFAKGAVVAVNSKGDFTHLLLLGPLAKHDIDASKLTVIEIGGSGGRVAALRAGRVDAVPVHLDQAQQLMAAEPGKFNIVIRPWNEFENWISEAWIVPSSFLGNPDNERALVDVLKAQIASFRKANADLGYFAEGYRNYATISNAKEASDDSLREIWQSLSKEARAWPEDGGFRRKDFEAMMPIWKRTGAIKGSVDLDKVLATQYVEQALQELGA
ncbi:ABC transporter substrate-binding protein [Roseomonas sp. E05]|uniref:ABC transporter substrate-binding protein n=1 Tax=Roseomonas sp. E05 TaxID=3046310 RepID=UPI0024BB6B31|nr:ABC transporter substrate-binding protein [Roseomonas sp. E05]MDJ0391244.1 ABC transporter substrate-binding protein [Roseomonas sp. E05]